MFLNGRKKYENGLNKDAVNKLESYERRMEDIRRTHDRYVEEIKSDTTLHNIQKQRKIRKADKDMYQELSSINEERKVFCEKNGIKKKKKKGDSILRTGKWGYKY